MYTYIKREKRDIVKERDNKTKIKTNSNWNEGLNFGKVGIRNTETFSREINLKLSYSFQLNLELLIKYVFKTWYRARYKNVKQHVTSKCIWNVYERFLNVNNTSLRYVENTHSGVNKNTGITRPKVTFKTYLKSFWIRLKHVSLFTG